jgi:fatty acid desaturase
MLPESKWGHAVAFVTTTLALGAASALGGLDFSKLPSWLVATAMAAAGSLAGILTSYAKRNS